MVTSALFHEMILDDLLRSLQREYPKDYLSRNLLYPFGEIDLLRITSDDRIVDYEVKGRDSPHGRIKAAHQLMRSGSYWHGRLPDLLVESHYVAGNPKLGYYQDFEFVNGLFLPINMKEGLL